MVWVRVLRVAWKKGVLVSHGEVVVVLDPQNNRLSCSPAFITHGHFDHSVAFKMSGVPKYSSQETFDLISSYGVQTESWHPVRLSTKTIIDDVEVIPHNSGHVLGSYEFEVLTPEGNVLFTGDFNTETTKTMKPAEGVRCDILVLEATFGSPSFVFPSEELIGNEMVAWARKIIKARRIPAFQTDPLGNAQEIIGIFNEANIPVVTHWKVSLINQVYEAYGHKLNYLDAQTPEAEEAKASGNLIFITPKQFSLQGRPEFVPALVSGWAIWSRDEAFPLSDHADFPRLLKFVEHCKPKIVLTCHSERFNETLARHIEKRLGIRAYPIHLIPTSLNNG